MPCLSVSQIEMLQLHLMEMEPFRGETEVPKEACQEGISGRMGSGLHNISRALAAMTAEGLVECRLCHFRGAPKRRKAYFLTEKGLHSTQSLIKDLESRLVSFDDGRSIKTLPLGEVMRSFEDRIGQKPKLWDFVELARSTDTLKLETQAVQARGTGSPRELEAFSFGRPVVDVFEGREAEFAELTNFVRSGEASCALLVGLPGIGKSTLASKVFESNLNQRSALWYSVHEWDSVQSILRMLIGFFPTAVNDRRFPDLDLEWEIADFFSPLVLSLRHTKPIIFLDDVDHSIPSVSVLISLLCDAVDAAPPSKIVLISRSIPRFLVPGLTRIKQVELRCLDKRSSSLLASKWDFHDPETAAEESGGHPLMLRLACEIGTEAARGSIDEILGEHFQRVLTAQEKSILAFLSIIRLPVPTWELPGYGPEILASLKRKGLVQEFAEGVAVHQVVRVHFNSKISPEEAARMHRIAAQYCQGRTGERWRLEEISQELSAGDWAKATEVVLENCEGLISDFAEESISLVSEIPVDRLEPISGARVSCVKGRLHLVLEMPNEAMRDFEHSLSLLQKGPDIALRATVQGFYAKIQSEANLLDESLETHRQALSYYESVADHDGQIREWMGMGSTWRKGHALKEASEAFQNALRIARERNDKAAMAANLNNLALLEWESGDLRRAEAGLKESISMARSARDTVGEGTGQVNLADLYAVQLRKRESENLRLESAETFKRAGDIVQYKTIKARWARVLSGEGRGAEAVAELERLIGASGRSIRSARGRPSVDIDHGDLALLLALIEVHRQSGDRERTMRSNDTFLNLAKDVERKDLEAQAEMEAALNEEIFGELTSALGHLRKAEVLLREIGNSEGLGAVYLRTGMVRLQMGEKNAALVELREAARHAERSANISAHAAALEELGEALGSVSSEGRECLDKASQLRRSCRTKAPERS